MSAQNDDHRVPSDRARALVRGAVDYHVHVAPDFVARRITDIELVLDRVAFAPVNEALASRATASA